MLRSLATEMQEPCLARWMGLFAPFWVRSPQTWRRGSEISLLNHLLVLYGVRLIYSQWFRNDHFPGIQMALLVHSAQGKGAV